MHGRWAELLDTQILLLVDPPARTRPSGSRRLKDISKTVALRQYLDVTFHGDREAIAGEDRQPARFHRGDRKDKGYPDTG
ncbi:hypothetical protein [Methanosphaerula subterraneus]|uniref:hypothetical protein n=1 Tax=Methanosphaerula subterraneus TaxID=3350244 RepID=UPI003F856B26